MEDEPPFLIQAVDVFPDIISLVGCAPNWRPAARRHSGFITKNITQEEMENVLSMLESGGMGLAFGVSSQDINQGQRSEAITGKNILTTTD
jgi:hypothetical protein